MDRNQYTTVLKQDIAINDDYVLEAGEEITVYTKSPIENGSPMISNPALLMACRNHLVFPSSLSRKAVVPFNISITEMEAPAMAGANVFENK